MWKTREPWWGYCRNMVRMYPLWAEAYKELHAVAVTAGYTGLPSGGDVASRTTEDAATRELTRTEQQSLEAVESAIRATERKRDGADRLKLIQLVYWPKRHERAITIRDACLKIPVSEKTALRWHRDFIFTVARFRGLLE